MFLPARRRIAAVALLLAAWLTACHPKIGAPGSRPALLLDQVNALQTTVRAGQEFTYAVVLLRSTSDSPVSIRKVELLGNPRGDVLQAVRTELAPLAENDPWPVRLWSSFPPTAKFGGRCQVLGVVPVEGHVIPPHAAARLVVEFRAVKAGHYSMAGQRVSYEVDGKPGSITLPNHFLVDVTLTETDLEVDPTERACAKLGNILPGAPGSGKG